MVYGLQMYESLPALPSAIVLENDYAVIASGGTTYPLAKKQSFEVGRVIQAGPTFFYRNNGGFTFPTATSYKLVSAPADGTNVIVPGTTRVIVKAYDNPTYGNVSETPVYLIDVDTIFTTQWEGPIGSSGLVFTLVLKDTNGPPLSWYAIAPANPDGTPGTYSGQTITLPNIVGLTTLTAPLTAGATSITVADGTKLKAGQFAKIGDDITQDQVTIGTIVGNTVQITPTANSYSSGTNVYDNGRKFWIKLTIPSTQSQAQNWYNVAGDMVIDAVNRDS